MTNNTQPGADWKLVPVEPTTAMYEAFTAECEEFWKLPATHQKLIAIEGYKAMLAAAPAQPPIGDVPTAIGNLLAVIHRDGGHYQAQHGTLKAIQDAEQEVVKLRAAPIGDVPDDTPNDKQEADETYAQSLQDVWEGKPTRPKRGHIYDSEGEKCVVCGESPEYIGGECSPLTHSAESAAPIGEQTARDAARYRKLKQMLKMHSVLDGISVEAWFDGTNYDLNALVDSLPDSQGGGK